MKKTGMENELYIFSPTLKENVTKSQHTHTITRDNVFRCSITLKAVGTVPNLPTPPPNGSLLLQSHSIITVYRMFESSVKKK